jgi:hypothetical protein
MVSFADRPQAVSGHAALAVRALFLTRKMPFRRDAQHPWQATSFQVKGTIFR